MSQQKSLWLCNFGGFCLFLFALLFLFCTCLVEPVDARPAADRGLTTRPGIWLAWLLPNLYFSSMRVVCWNWNYLPLLRCTSLTKLNAIPWMMEGIVPSQIFPVWVLSILKAFGMGACSGSGSQTQNWFVSKVSSLPEIALWQVQEMVNLLPLHRDTISNLGMYNRNVKSFMQSEQG